MRNTRVLLLVEIALTVALATVLSLIQIKLPWVAAGGSISLAMLPIFVLALRRGVWPGVVAGVLYGAVDLIREPWIIHPVQVMLDYGVAFGACGLAGLGASAVDSAIRSRSLGKAGALVAAWTVVGALGRFAGSYVSGIVFYGANAPEGQPVWLYSALYNLSYIAPSAIACAVLAAIIVPALSAAIPVRIGEVG